MLNVKRRCRLNLNISDDLYLNNNNNNHVVEKVGYAEKLCLQHNKLNCAAPEVCTIVFMPHMASIVINDINHNKYIYICQFLMHGFTISVNNVICGINVFL